MFLKKLLSIIILIASFVITTYAQPEETLDNLLTTYQILQAQVTDATDQQDKKTLKQKMSDLLAQIDKQSQRPLSTNDEDNNNKESNQDVISGTKEDLGQNIKTIDAHEESKKRLYEFYTQLGQTKKDVTSVMSALFTPSLLSKQEENIYQILVRAWETKLNDAQSKIDAFASSLNQIDELCINHASSQILKIKQFASKLLETYFKLQLLTIDLSDTKSAVIAKAYSRGDLQKLMLIIWKKLDDQCDAHECRLLDFDTTEMLRGVLSSDLLGTWLSRCLPINEATTRTKKLYQLLDVNFLDIDKIIAHHYLSFMNDYYCNPKQELTTKLEQLDLLLSLLEEKNKEEKKNCIGHLITQRHCNIINLLLAKLLSIKQELNCEKKLEELAKNHPEKIDLFIQYNSLASTEKVQELIDQLNPVYDYSYGCCGYDEEREDKLQDLFSAYKIAIETYFNQESYKTGQLLTIGSLKHQLIDLKKDYDQSYVSFGLFGLKKESKTLQEFINILSIIENHIKTSLGIDSNQNIWQSLLDNKKMLEDNLKSSKVFSSLVHASPLLGIALLKFVSPHVNTNLKNRILAFLGTQPKEKPDKDKLLEFVKNNPEISVELSKKDPEFFQLLAGQVKNLA